MATKKQAQVQSLGNPPARAIRPKSTQEEYASVSDFKVELGYVDLRLPSGKLCRARRVDLNSFLAQGMVPNALMPMMKGAMNGDSSKVDKLTLDDIDMKTLGEMMQMIDHCVCEAVRIPRVHPVPSGAEERDDALLYVDEIQEEDKQFIFSWAVGGTADIAKFRDGSQKILANLQAGKRVGDKAKPAARSKR